MDIAHDTTVGQRHGGESVSAVANLVGWRVMERAARHWIMSLREEAEVESATPRAVDVVIAPAAGAYLQATASLVEALVDLRGSEDGLTGAEARGVDVREALNLALGIAASRLAA
ncbi:hypothetical protein [Microbacterium plantarum]|uniref:Uncharacterized protein n=1 Tax=Microbacterium plantarum TaxID=1816425 RepID=A0ABV5ESV4_9MICO